jgi:RNA polymerase sigma-70 factor (sigma-E family)
VAAIYGSDGELVGDRPDPAALAAAAPAVDVAALHREHFLHLTRLAAMLVGDRQTAEDIVQDVFAAMQGRWRRFSEPDRALRYLRASVINGARTALRRRRTAVRYQPDPPPDEAPADELALAHLRDRSVRDALARLPSRQQEVILLRYLEDLSVADTARALGISSGAVKSSAGRAMRSLAAMLGADHDH